jgi:hypothetical protein
VHDLVLLGRVFTGVHFTESAVGQGTPEYTVVENHCVTGAVTKRQVRVQGAAHQISFIGGRAGGWLTGSLACECECSVPVSLDYGPESRK